MLKKLYVLILFAVLALAGPLHAKTYKLTVTTELENFSIDGYGGDLSTDPFDEIVYNITDANDPILENFDADYTKAAFATAGIIFVEDYLDIDIDAYRVSGCKGVFLKHCSLGDVFYGQMNTLGFELSSFDIFGGVDLSSLRGTISAATDDDYSWTNSAGSHYTNNGETMIHDLKTYTIQVVPLPASMPLILGGLVLLGLAGRRRS